MPISPDDLLVKLSVTTGSAGNTTAGTPAGSLGKYISTTLLTDAALNNLFDNVTTEENAAFDVEYRCVFIHNANSSLTLQNPVIWIVSDVAGGSSIAISVDTTAASAFGASSAQGKTIANESIAPTSQSFSSPSNKSSGLSLSNIGPNQVKAIWVRRSALNSTSFANDGATLRIEGETGA